MSAFEPPRVAAQHVLAEMSVSASETYPSCLHASASNSDAYGALHSLYIYVILGCSEHNLITVHP